jgi:hypothetical protein
MRKSRILLGIIALAIFVLGFFTNCVEEYEYRSVIVTEINSGPIFGEYQITGKSIGDQGAIIKGWTEVKCEVGDTILLQLQITK